MLELLSKKVYAKTVGNRKRINRKSNLDEKDHVVNCYFIRTP